MTNDIRATADTDRAYPLAVLKDWGSNLQTAANILVTRFLRRLRQVLRCPGRRIRRKDATVFPNNTALVTIGWLCNDLSISAAVRASSKVSAAVALEPKTFARTESCRIMSALILRA